MEAVEALIVSRAIERTAFMLCAPLLLYLGYRLFDRALVDNGQARADLRDKYKFQKASFLPGSACILLAMVIGFTLFFQAARLSKAEEDLVVMLDRTTNPIPRNAAPVVPPGGSGGAILGGNTKPPLRPS